MSVSSQWAGQSYNHFFYEIASVMGDCAVSTVGIFVLGVALSADAFAVTISNCFVYGEGRRSRLLLMPLFFGAFQALMPLLGYYLGGLAAELIEAYSGMVALVILGIIGGNMVREGAAALMDPSSRDACQIAAEEGEVGRASRLTVGTLLFQAVATAIDAFAVGVSLRAMEVDLPLAVGVIGLTTAACCVAALAIGRRLGCLLGDRAEVAGGVVLVLIGLMAFLE